MGVEGNMFIKSTTIVKISLQNKAGGVNLAWACAQITPQLCMEKRNNRSHVDYTLQQAYMCGQI